jgi:hypothetical protein
MRGYSQIANVCASPDFRKTHNYLPLALSHTADMDDDNDKNGGPNHLRAWMRFRGVKGVELAEALGGNVTPGMVSDLANSKRALSAKWLRRIAPILDTTPGMLLDHDPYELDADIIDIWNHASKRQQRQLVDLARVVVSDKTGTHDG